MEHLRRWLVALGCALATAAPGGYAASEPANGVREVVVPPAVAEPPQTGGVAPLPHYPPGSIGSTEAAERALTEAKVARLLQEKEFVTRRQACYGMLVAEPCLRHAIEDNAVAERKIRAVEVEARAFKRSQTERDAAAVRSARPSRDSEADAGKSSGPLRVSGEQQQRIKRNAAVQREFEAGAGERARHAERERKRLESKRAARLKKEAEQRAGAAERAQRAHAHEEKVKEVLERAQQKEARARNNAEAGKNK